MRDSTRRLWERQNQHPGDRLRLFSAVAEAFAITSVLYPGSWVDVAASFVFDDVTYVDIDRQAARFFADAEGVDELIAQNRIADTPARWAFISQDYTSRLDLADETTDLLVSLYAGFVSEHCTRHLRPGGVLLVNDSHGDAAMASIDPRYELVAAVTSSSGTYAIHHDDLDTYLTPKRATEITIEGLHATGRGIAYSKRAFAYVFRHRV